MTIPKKDIIQQLRREIIALNGLRHVPMDHAPLEGMGLFADHFPQGRFPLGAVHEVKPFSAGDQPAALGFSLALMQTVLPAEGIIAWVSPQPWPLYAPGLRQIGIDPARVIFFRAGKPADRHWAMEEAMQCKPLAAVVGELDTLDFKQSRRLQLAAEKSGVTAWVLPSAKASKTNASSSRWSIRSLPSHTEDALPGIGDPHWQVELLHMRHGKPGSWSLCWRGGQFLPTAMPYSITTDMEGAGEPAAIALRGTEALQPFSAEDLPPARVLASSAPLQPFPAADLLHGFYIHEKRVYA